MSEEDTSIPPMPLSHSTHGLPGRGVPQEEITIARGGGSLNNNLIDANCGSLIEVASVRQPLIFIKLRTLLSLELLLEEAKVKIGNSDSPVKVTCE